jgi:hypothetical protein
VYERKRKRQRNGLLFKVKNVVGNLEICRDTGTEYVQDAESAKEPWSSISWCATKSCVKKRKDKEKLERVLDNRQPFMNGLGILPMIVVL